MPMLTIRTWGWLVALVVLCASLGAGDSKTTVGNTGSDPETFAEPYRTIQVATGDAGLIREVLVREGDTVEARQPLVHLDDELTKASLEIAKHHAAAKGALNSSEAELRLHSSRAEKLEALLAGGHARPEEAARAVMERDISIARVLAAHESLTIRKLELERIHLELERRIVRSPIKGVVTKVHREIGEFVAPTDPVVVTVVQLDPLLATFSLKPAQAQSLRVGKTVPVQFASDSTPVNGEVELISAVTDARSGTVRVKIRIPNADGRCRSGDRCSLILPQRATNTAEHAEPSDAPANKKIATPKLSIKPAITGSAR